MKRNLLFILVLLKVTLGLGASPIASSITYQYIAVNNYKIIYKGVRDCRGTPFNSSGLLPLIVTCDSGSKTVNMSRTSIRNITINAPGACNPPNNSTNIGSEEHQYEYLLNLDTFAGGSFKSSCKFTFSITVCCRTGSVNTMNSGAMYYECMLDRCLASDNSGPAFLNTRNIYARYNQPNYFNPMVLDTTDSDILIYELFTPMFAKNSYTTYNTGYSQDFPLTPLCTQAGQKNCMPLPLSIPPRGLFHDSLSGNLIYTPTNSNEVSVICYKVNEYRMINGSRRLIGYYITDHLMVVANNIINEPLLSKNSMKLEHRVKIGQSIRINLITEHKDTMKTDSVRMFITNPVKGSLDSVNLAWRSTGSFDWTPGCKDIRKQPYIFIVSFYSERPWVYDFQSIAIKIYVDPDLNIGHDTNICRNKSLQLRSNISGKYRWNGNSGDSTDVFTAQNAGKYWLDVTRNNCTVSDTIYLKELTELPKVRLAADTIICDQPINSPITLFTPYENNVLYSWNVNPSNKTSVLLFNGSGTVIVKGENVCGESFDSIQISRLYTPDISLPADTHLCHPFNYTIHIKGNNETLSRRWSTNDTDSTLSVNQEGLYWVIAENDCGNDRDSISILASRQPILELGPDTIVCNGNYPFLDVFFPDCQYKWSDGSVDPVLQIPDSGLYFVSISNLCGKSTDSIRVSSRYTPQIDIGSDTAICLPFNHTLNARYPHSSYIWNTGSVNEEIRIKRGGKFFVSVTNLCGSTSDTISITEKSLPVVNLGNDTGLRKPFSLLLKGPDHEDRYSWNNSSSDTFSQLLVSEFGWYWLRAENSCGSDIDSILVSDLSNIQVTQNEAFSIFPNPGSGNIHVLSQSEIISIQVFDITGKECLINPVFDKPDRVLLNLSDFESGYYYLIVKGQYSNGRYLIQVLH